MKKNITLITLALLSFGLNGQQIIESSQYMNNDYAFNTAVAGTKANLRVSLGARKQWVGFEGSPLVQNVTFQGRVAKKIGLGASVYNDTWGLSRRTGLNLGVNYIMEATRDIDISFGLSAIVTQFSINRDKVVTEIPDDVAVYDGIGNQLFPDAGISVYASSKDFFGGISATNIIQVKSDLSNSLSNKNYLARTIYLIGGGTFEVADAIVVEPSAILANTANSPTQIQADVKVEYDHLFWGGVGYRLNDAVVINAGVFVSTFTIGYSYDVTVSSLGSSLGGGSHEIFVAFDILKNNKKSSWFKRNRIYNQNRR
jgi:type IX secretion system PorP/SprF family membrane protein